ncbi:MAG: cell cycle transcriptional regulator TrcR [Hyphomicrobiaceae bacterium]|nr:cell cycle transcriptional regulator TrcR [Hyphomicrobiaceae bacterium]
MSNRTPLMPKATAVWLVENTSLSFDQIAEFCGLHNLEVKGIADGDVAQGIKGQDPISSGQLSREEIARAEANPNHRLRLAEPKYEMPAVKTKKGPRYTPVSRRQDRPNAVLWLLRNHPELKDSQIMRLVGTTKPTIAAIRERTHWNSPNLQPQDPVTLGLCSQLDLDAEVKKSSKRVVPLGEQPVMPVAERAGTLLPASATIPGLGDQPVIDDLEPAADERARVKAESDEDRRVFAKLQQLTRPSEDGEGLDEEDAQPSVDSNSDFADTDAEPADKPE